MEYQYIINDFSITVHNSILDIISKGKACLDFQAQNDVHIRASALRSQEQNLKGIHFLK